LSQVLDHYAQAFARGAATLPQQEKGDSEDAQRSSVNITSALFTFFDSRATHAPTLLPASLASTPFEFVLARVRVRVLYSGKEPSRRCIFNEFIVRILG
jgi:hypothetical protein